LKFADRVNLKKGKRKWRKEERERKERKISCLLERFIQNWNYGLKAAHRKVNFK